MHKKSLALSLAALGIAAAVNLPGPAHAAATGAVDRQSRMNASDDVLNLIAEEYRRCGVGALTDVHIVGEGGQHTVKINRGAWAAVGGRQLSPRALESGATCAHEALARVVSGVEGGSVTRSLGAAARVELTETAAVDGSVSEAPPSVPAEELTPQKGSIDGGGDLTVEGFPACSSAFLARHKKLGVGLLTADHCTDVADYTPPDTSRAVFEYQTLRTAGKKQPDSQFGSVLLNQALGAEVEAKFGAWKFSKDFRFNHDTNRVRTVRAVRNAKVGERVCHTGASSSAMTCGKVGQVDTSVYYPAIDKPYLGMMTVLPIPGAKQPLRCIAGDSGGPWFKGSIAVGVNSGMSTSSAVDHPDGLVHCIVSQIEETEKALNVQVLTSAKSKG